MFADTILAISSPPPPSGIRGIVRMSGPASWALARSATDLAKALAPGWYDNLTLHNLPPIPLAAVMLFQAPRSFTGEDIAELHLPNSPALLRHIIDDLLNHARQLNLPTRLADPGEFSARAFFNGKLDLTQAEGIAATIAATDRVQLRAAASLRQGNLHQWTAEITDRLANLLALIEAGIDFTDEEGVSFIERAQLEPALDQLAKNIHDQLEAAIRIDRLSSPPTIVFIGQPNVGKSSLINALADQERSIVSPIAGTTRDMLAATLHTAQGDIRLIDVPGEEPPSDELRQKMMAARESALLDADLIVEIFDCPNALPSASRENIRYSTPYVAIQNKADLSTNPKWATHSPGQFVSAKTGLHIPELRDALTQLASRGESSASNRLTLNHRHRAILLETQTVLHDAASLLQTTTADQHPELLAAELRRALDLLGQITGMISPDEILGRVFSQFCIGK